MYNMQGILVDLALFFITETVAFQRDLIELLIELF